MTIFYAVNVCYITCYKFITCNICIHIFISKNNKVYNWAMLTLYPI